MRAILEFADAEFEAVAVTTSENSNLVDVEFMAGVKNAFPDYVGEGSVCTLQLGTQRHDGEVVAIYDSTLASPMAPGKLKVTNVVKIKI